VRVHRNCQPSFQFAKLTVKLSELGDPPPSEFVTSQSQGNDRDSFLPRIYQPMDH
jgi:hypothetical protein